MFSKLYRFLSRIVCSAVSRARAVRIRHTGHSSEARSSALKLLLGFLASAIRRAFRLMALSLAPIFGFVRSFRQRRADAKLASALSDLVQQYRWLCQEIEWLKCRVVGADSCPIDSRRWKAWKCRQASKRHLDADRSLLSELSDDPHFQRLVKLQARLRDVQHEMRGYEASYLANQAFIDEVIFSFPSLKRRLGPSYLGIEFEQILWAGETVDPQAFFAAVFVRTLQSFEYCCYQSVPTFFIDRAFEVWDDEHKRVFAHWIALPYFPDGAFRTLSVKPPSV